MKLFVKNKLVFLSSLCLLAMGSTALRRRNLKGCLELVVTLAVTRWLVARIQTGLAGKLMQTRDLSLMEA